MDEIHPQYGPQRRFLETPADIAITGGGAGGGKTMSLLLEAARNIQVPGYRGVIFRRTSKQVFAEGGLWDASQELYRSLGGVSRESKLDWTFPSGASIGFAHLEYEKHKLDWQGSQIAFIGFDELTHFCLTPDHDVLTQRGWVPIADVTRQDCVLSRVGQHAEFLPVTDTPSFGFDGELVSVSQRNGISLRATPNHRILVERQDNHKSLGFVTAEYLSRTTQNIPRKAIIGGADRTAPIEFTPICGRGIGSNQNSVTQCDVDVWLPFLGWYLSEGSTSDSTIRITQTRHNPILDADMRRIPWRAGCLPRGDWYVCSRQLANHLKPMGDCYTKRVPRWVMQCSVRQINLFLDAFVAGDGHRTKSGGIQIGLANKGLRDDLHELFVLSGRIATAHDGFDTTGRFAVYRLGVSSQTRDLCMVQPESVRREHYAGKVYCLTVDYPETTNVALDGHHRLRVSGGNFLVRHNGRCHFTGNSQGQWWYMMSRLRSMSGVRPYIRATCNPDPDSFVANLLSWWIDQDTGYSIPERSGVLRYFVRHGDEIIWGDTPRATLIAAHKAGADCANSDVRSFTFVPSRVTDNPILLAKNPEYVANLRSMCLVDRARLLDGNWAIRPTAGTMFRSEWYDILDDLPASAGAPMCIRYWDRAATEAGPGDAGPDWTVGLKLARCGGMLTIEHVARMRVSPANVQAAIRRLAEQDGPNTVAVLERDPGQAGKAEIHYLLEALQGLPVRWVSWGNKDKVTRAKLASAESEQGRVKLLRGAWNTPFLRELEGFPTQARHDDQVDAFSGAVNVMLGRAEPRVRVA